MCAVSEEDVLAAGLISILRDDPRARRARSLEDVRALFGLMCDLRNNEPGYSVVAAVWRNRITKRYGAQRALADAERRYVVEKCKREVLEAVEDWDANRFGRPNRLFAALQGLRRAREAL